MVKVLLLLLLKLVTRWRWRRKRRGGCYDDAVGAMLRDLNVDRIVLVRRQQIALALLEEMLMLPTAEAGRGWRCAGMRHEWERGSGRSRQLLLVVMTMGRRPRLIRVVVAVSLVVLLKRLLRWRVMLRRLLGDREQELAAMTGVAVAELATLRLRCSQVVRRQLVKLLALRMRRELGRLGRVEFLLGESRLLRLVLDGLKLLALTCLLHRPTSRCIHFAVAAFSLLLMII